MKVVVIGGGPAGMLASISATKSGNKVILLEKMHSLGRKLLITGKGRCNITSSLKMDEFIQNIPGNGKFLFSCFQNFTNQDIISLLNKHGVDVKTERGNRIFPVSDKSKDVLDALIKELKLLGVQIKTDAKVKNIDVKNSKIVSVILENGEVINADKVILATGGKSYPATGSTGDGYEIASKLGHTITKIKPSLVPLTVKQKRETEEYIKKSSYGTSLNLCKSLQGLSLKNVGIKIKDKDKVLYEDFGEMVFTHFGVSGPTILSSSAHLLRVKNIESKLDEGAVKLIIDLKPALTYEKLDLRIRRDFEKEINKQFKNSLDDLLPKKLIDVVINLSKIDPNKKVNEVTKVERNVIVKLLKEFTVTLQGFRPIEEAIVTAGGINIKEINPKTMESKIVKGLYFAGEIIDVDAYTGGFNLQIAYSTGYTAGMS